MRVLDECEMSEVNGGTDAYESWREGVEDAWNELLRRLDWEKSRQA